MLVLLLQIDNKLTLSFSFSSSYILATCSTFNFKTNFSEHSFKFTSSELYGYGSQKDMPAIIKAARDMLKKHIIGTDAGEDLKAFVAGL